jgi:hypothetical protein
LLQLIGRIAVRCCIRWLLLCIAAASLLCIHKAQFIVP